MYLVVSYLRRISPHRSNLRKFASLFPVLGFLLASFLFGQDASLDRPRTYDVLNYTIRLRFDVAAKTVYGDTTVTLTPLTTPLSQVSLDEIGLGISSVTLDPTGKVLRYKAATGTVNVQLDRQYKPGENAAIRFKYK